MLVVHVDKNIEKALKMLKSKVIKTKQNQKLNSLREYKKKSFKIRTKKIKASYVEKFKNQEE